MRVHLMIVMLFLFAGAKAQSMIGDRYINNTYGGAFVHQVPSFDSISHHKWSFSKYVNLSAGYSFFRGGGTSFISVPVGLQLNRKLTERVSAFAGVSVVPVYLSNFNNAFLPGDFMKTTTGNSFNKPGNLGMYSRAELGLMYTNEAKTFSISGSIGVERRSTPIFYPIGTGVRQSPVMPYRQ